VWPWSSGLWWSSCRGGWARLGLWRPPGEPLPARATRGAVTTRRARVARGLGVRGAHPASRGPVRIASRSWLRVALGRPRLRVVLVAWLLGRVARRPPALPRVAWLA